MPRSDVTFIPEGGEQPRRSRSPVPWLLAVLVVAAVVTPFLLGGGGAEKIAWRGDFAGAEAEATLSNKRILLDFTADWCPPCKQMKRDVFSQTTVKDAIESQFVPVRVDMTAPGPDQRHVAEFYHVQYLPTLIIIEPRGQEISRQVGGLSETQLLDWLRNSH